MIGTVSYLLLMLVVSIAAGLLGSLVGIGGGILVVPILTLGFDIPIHYAIGASIVAVIGTSSGAASAFIKDGISNFKVGTFLNAATTSAAVIGSVLSIYLIDSGLSWMIYMVFGVILTISACDLYRKSRAAKKTSVFDCGVVPNRIADALDLRGEYYDASLKQKIPYEAGKVPEGFGVMAVAGLLSGLLGIGSGSLNVLGMDCLMRLPFKVSTTTSNFMIGVSAAASAGIFFLRGYVNMYIVGPVATGVVIGSFVGARLVERSNPNLLRVVFVLVLIVSGLEMLQKGLVMI